MSRLFYALVRLSQKEKTKMNKFDRINELGWRWMVH